jgi:hypothetical protein
MGAYKSTARAVGILFIVASATAIIGGLLMVPATSDDYLTEAASSGTAIVSGALLELVLAMSVVAIATLVFPILRREHEGTALAYAGARTLEAVLIMAGTISGLLGLTVSRHVASGGTAPDVIGELIIGAREWTYWLGPMAMFSVSAVILNVLLYRSQIVPRWLSVWGGVGGVLLLVSALFEMYGTALGGWQAVFTAPIGVQEMVFAVWLIWKGFAERTVVPEIEPTRYEVGV